MENKGGVRFIRKNGRVIPIRKKVGDALQGAGGAALVGGIATQLVGVKGYSDNIAKAKGYQKAAMDSLFYNEGAAAKMSFNTFNIISTQSGQAAKKSAKLVKVGGLIGAAGVGLTLAGVGLSYSAGKKRKK